MQPQYVARGQAPGPATVGASCVYVLRRPDGHFYAGSTDALHDRIRAHRQVRPDTPGPAGCLVFDEAGLLLGRGRWLLPCLPALAVHAQTSAGMLGRWAPIMQPLPGPQACASQAVGTPNFRPLLCPLRAAHRARRP